MLNHKKANKVPVITAQNVAKSTLPWEKLIIANAPKIEANVPPANPSKPSIIPPAQQATITKIKSGIYKIPIENCPSKGILITSQPNFQ